MNNLRKAAEQALEALKAGTDVDPIFAGETIDALRAALAQPEQDPDVTGWKLVPPNWVAIPLEPTENQWMYAQGVFLDFGWDATTRFAAMVQELVACTREQLEREMKNAPPQRKPLTDEA